MIISNTIQALSNKGSFSPFSFLRFSIFASTSLYNDPLVVFTLSGSAHAINTHVSDNRANT